PMPFDDVEQARHVEHVPKLDVDLLEDVANEPIVAMAGKDDGAVSFADEPAARFRAHHPHPPGDQDFHAFSLRCVDLGAGRARRQRAFAAPVMGWPIPNGTASISTKATRARRLVRLAQAWLVPRWTMTSPAFIFTVESSVSMSISPSSTMT